MIDLRFRVVYWPDKDKIMKTASATALQKCCPKSRDLGEQFALAARLYAEAVVVLTRAVPAMADFEESCGAVEQARQECDEAGAAFRDHITTHGCWNYSPDVSVSNGGVPNGNVPGEPTA
jgi:hypothetical protein